MKAFFKALGGMFLDTNGKVSAKRVNGFILIVSGVVLGAVTKNPDLMWPCFVSGGALLGVSIGEKPKVEAIQITGEPEESTYSGK